MEKPQTAPESFSRPDTQLRLAKLRAEIQELEENISYGENEIASKKKRVENEAAYLKSSQELFQVMRERLKTTKDEGIAETLQENINELEASVVESQIYVDAVKQSLNVFMTAVENLKPFLNEIEGAAAKLIDQDRLSGASEGRPFPRIQA